MDVYDNPDERRYESWIDGRLAGFAAYRRSPGSIVFTHTEVAVEYEGRGVGSGLARTALEAARSDGLLVTPRCPFFAGYIRRHPEFADLLTAG